MSEDIPLPFDLPAVARKKVSAAFDGGRITSDGGVMLLAQAERRLGIADQLAREAVARIRRHSDQCLIVHYSCQSFYDDREGLSPRIASIVVKNFANDQTISFAINFTAEQLRIAKVDIDSKFDEIETRMLGRFFLPPCAKKLGICGCTGI